MNIRNTNVKGRNNTTVLTYKARLLDAGRVNHDWHDQVHAEGTVSPDLMFSGAAPDGGYMGDEVFVNVADKWVRGWSSMMKVGFCLPISEWDNLKLQWCVLHDEMHSKNDMAVRLRITRDVEVGGVPVYRFKDCFNGILWATLREGKHLADRFNTGWKKKYEGKYTYHGKTLLPMLRKLEMTQTERTCEEIAEEYNCWEEYRLDSSLGSMRDLTTG
tara:strand:- start:132 stop:779 length:648 start_codon:yes stop_codon:yes gene_type:complete